MIKCNLAVLLAERNIKISDLARKTGISRTTITALFYNQSKGIQFDTFDTLCTFLKVTPNDLFTQELFEYDFMVEDTKNAEQPYDVCFSIKAEIKYKSETITESFDCQVDIDENSFGIIEGVVLYPKYTPKIIEIVKSLPISFKLSMETELAECIKAELALSYEISEDVEMFIR